MKLTLPTDSKIRKDYPMATGCDEYFPAALAGVARHSFLAGARHTPGEPMHHKRGASMDHTDCIRRHMTDMADMLAWLAREPEVPTGDVVVALMAEADALAWRALAYSQQLHETHGGAPLAPAARMDPPSTDHTAAEVVALAWKPGDGICATPGCGLRAGHDGLHVADSVVKEVCAREPEEPGMTRVGRAGFDPAD